MEGQQVRETQISQSSALLDKSIAELGEITKLLAERMEPAMRLPEPEKAKAETPPPRPVKAALAVRLDDFSARVRDTTSFIVGLRDRLEI